MSDANLRLVFWELTASCNLKCKHCRAEAQSGFAAGELTTEEIFSVARDIRETGNPIMILTGGEPLARPDFFDIAKHCSTLFSRVAIATNGTLVTDDIARRIADSGILRASVSIDGSNKTTHDAFRGQPGSFDSAMSGLAALHNAGLSTQINMTVARHNVGELLDVIALAKKCKADAFHVFVLVPVGCGASIEDDMRLTPKEMDDTLNLLLDQSIALTGQLHIKATCAPQYYRIMKQRGVLPSAPHGAGHGHHSHGAGHGGMQATTKGCLAGSAVCFLSRTGNIQPCGYLPVVVGNVRETCFKEIWQNAEEFKSLRTPSSLEGKCGACGYKDVCEGCRARAFAETNNFLAEDPDCLFCQKK